MKEKRALTEPVVPWGPEVRVVCGGVVSTVKERAALLAYLHTQGVELRPAPNRSNVISHMYSIGPDHGKQYLVGLTYHARTQTWADVTGNKAIAIPFAPVNRHWVLWRVGGPGGNASQEFQTAWEKTLDALRGYEERT